jgi:DNA-binding response OmpR family regulator
VDSAEVFAWALRRAGHDVRVALDGVAALAAATEEKPHIAILDIGMPRMNGYDAARQIRAALGNTVLLVAMTGWGQEEDRQRAREAGFDHHLTKPVDLAAVEQLIALRESPAHPERA